MAAGGAPAVPRPFLILLVILASVAVAVMAIAPPLPQTQSYHAFADQRVLWGIPHAGDVLTNAGFLVAGLCGLWALSAHRRALKERQVWLLPYLLFAIGLILVSGGSTYYHWAPNNETLFWDRLSMSIAFMALLAAIISTRVSLATGKASLPPLLAIGAASVVYWRLTDDLRPYFLMQGSLAILLLAMSWMLPPRNGLQGGALRALIGFYMIAFVCEQFDAPIWDLLGHTVSGHNLKHVAAACAGGTVVTYLLKVAAVQTTKVAER